MKLRHSLVLLPLLGTGTLCASVAFDFSSFGSALISFQGTGDTLQFTHDFSGFDFRITNAGDPGLNGMLGRIDGTFTIGPISTVGSVQEAPITGFGQLMIANGTAVPFTAKLAWSSILTIGTAGVLNPPGAFNLSDFSYHGTNASLQSLATNTMGVDTVSFQFLPVASLSQLTLDGTTHFTTFSGSISAVPEPAFFAALMGAAALLAVVTARRRAAPAMAA